MPGSSQVTKDQVKVIYIKLHWNSVEGNEIETITAHCKKELHTYAKRIFSVIYLITL